MLLKLTLVQLLFSLAKLWVEKSCTKIFFTKKLLINCCWNGSFLDQNLYTTGVALLLRRKEEERGVWPLCHYLSYHPSLSFPPFATSICHSASQPLIKFWLHLFGVHFVSLFWSSFWLKQWQNLFLSFLKCYVKSLKTIFDVTLWRSSKVS